MSQFIPGDIVTSKSGTRYRVLWVMEDGTMGVFPASGKGAQRRLNAANATMVHAAAVVTPSRTERREAATRQARQEDASLTAQQEAMADMYGPTFTEPATDGPPRVLSPMDRDRQVRRMAAEIRGHQPEQRWDALTLAAALYDAGYRATDPGSPLQ